MSYDNDKKENKRMRQRVLESLDAFFVTSSRNSIPWGEKSRRKSPGANNENDEALGYIYVYIKGVKGR